MIFKDIEVVVFVKRVTITTNGKVMPWSCYDICVPIKEIAKSHGYELAEEIRAWINKECAYLEGDEINPQVDKKTDNEQFTLF